MEYRWLVTEAGRGKGQTESLDDSSAVTKVWIHRGWIEAIPQPKAPEPVQTAEMEGPPADRAVMRGTRGLKRKADDEDLYRRT